MTKRIQFILLLAFFLVVFGAPAVYSSGLPGSVGGACGTLTAIGLPAVILAFLGAKATGKPEDKSRMTKDL